MKDARGHGSDPRGAARLDNVASPARKTGYLAKPTPKYAINKNAARTSEGGRLSTAASERIALRQAADASRYHVAVTDRVAATALGQGHMKSGIVPLGRSFEMAQEQLARARTMALPRGDEHRRKS